jgi:hypothetical protein
MRIKLSNDILLDYIAIVVTIMDYNLTRLRQPLEKLCYGSIPNLPVNQKLMQFYF